jgi:hypothetical protein
MIFYAGSIIRIKRPTPTHLLIEKLSCTFWKPPQLKGETRPNRSNATGRQLVFEMKILTSKFAPRQKKRAGPHGGTPSRESVRGCSATCPNRSLSEACPGRRPASARRWLLNAELLGPGTSMHCGCLSMLPPLVIRCIRPRDLPSVNGLLALSETPVTCPRLSDLFRGEHPAGSVLPPCFLSISGQLVRKSDTAGRK